MCWLFINQNIYLLSFIISYNVIIISSLLSYYITYQSSLSHNINDLIDISPRDIKSCRGSLVIYHNVIIWQIMTADYLVHQWNVIVSLFTLYSSYILLKLKFQNLGLVEVVIIGGECFDILSY